MPSKTERALAIARGAASSARKKVDEITISSAKRIADVRRRADTDSHSERMIAAAEGVAGGIAGGLLDAYTDPIGESVPLPVSLPVAIVATGLGLVLGRKHRWARDLARGGTGMLSYVAGSLTRALAPMGDGQ